MPKKVITKLLGLNLGIALADVILFSRAFFGLAFSLASPLSFSLAVTAAVMSGIVFVYGNTKILKAPERAIIPGLPETASLEDWLPRLKEAPGRGTAFRPMLEKASEQIRRFIKMRGKITELLLHRFSPGEMSYSRFDSAVTGLSQLMARNARRLLSRVAAFDDAEYKRLLSAGPLTGTPAQRMALYTESLQSAGMITEGNDEVLLRLDMLLAELSKLGDDDADGRGASHAMEEIDALIKNAKLYN